MATTAQKGNLRNSENLVAIRFASLQNRRRSSSAWSLADLNGDVEAHVSDH